MTFRPGRRGLAVSTVLAVSSLALTACSAGSLGSSDNAGGGSVEITYLTTNQDQDVKEAEQLAKDFHAKNPSITVKVETRPGGTEGDNLIKTRLSTGDMVDVFNYNTGSLFNAIAPQKNLLSVNDEPWVADLDDNFKKTVTADGQVYGAPVGGFQGGAVLYSIPVYTKLGLKVPTTWAEFMANNAKIKASGGGVAPVIQTYGETWTSQLFVLGDFHNVSAAEPDFADKYTAEPGEVRDVAGRAQGIRAHRGRPRRRVREQGLRLGQAAGRSQDACHRQGCALPDPVRRGRQHGRHLPRRGQDRRPVRATW